MQYERRYFFKARPHVPSTKNVLIVMAKLHVPLPPLFSLLYPPKVGNYEEAAVQLAACVNDDDFVSPKGHSKHAMWMRLCDLCADHPNEVAKSLKVKRAQRQQQNSN